MPARSWGCSAEAHGGSRQELFLLQSEIAAGLIPDTAEQAAGTAAGARASSVVPPQPPAQQLGLTVDSP